MLFYRFLLNTKKKHNKTIMELYKINKYVPILYNFE